jgi:hypothetical protein
LIELSRPPVGGQGEWGRRGLRLLRASGASSIDDGKALFQKRGAAISDTTSPARLAWIDGSPTGFAFRLLSDPAQLVRVTRGALDARPGTKTK